MRKLFWKLRYALDLCSRTGLDFDSCWDCAGTSWKDNGEDMTPSEAVDEELACWGD